jgi:uncharacterized protein (DUF1778 family)
MTGNLYLRVSDETKALIRDGAAKCNTTLSEFVRWCVEEQYEMMCEEVLKKKKTK